MRPWFLALLLLACKTEKKPEPVRVAAAADLTDAFTDLGRRFEAATHTPVTFSFGSSGLLAKQVSEGAPFDVFAAANRAYVEQAVTAGACEATSKHDYARGRLALWSPAGTVTLDALSSDAIKRIALANPEHAPYGLAAKQTLEHAGLWDALRPKLVFSENVRQALQFAETGNVDVAFIAWSNVVARDAGHATLIDAALHAPLQQALVRCTRGKNAEGGRRFAEFLEGAEAREVMRRYGFE